jgi:hypothetical protein
MSDSLHFAQVGPVRFSSVWRRIEMIEAVARESVAELIM